MFFPSVITKSMTQTLQLQGWKVKQFGFIEARGLETGSLNEEDVDLYLLPLKDQCGPI